ncbi:MAG: hypothetical protein WA673_11220 [Candidatus Acidiferrales bacterium]
MIVTATPGRAAPFWSVTTPETLDESVEIAAETALVCASATRATQKKRKNDARNRTLRENDENDGVRVRIGDTDRAGIAAREIIMSSPEMIKRALPPESERQRLGQCEAAMRFNTIRVDKSNRFDALSLRRQKRMAV